MLLYYIYNHLYLFIPPSLFSPGQRCRCYTRRVRCPGGTTTFPVGCRSPGPVTTRAASPRIKAALTRGTPCRTWRRYAPTLPSCSETCKRHSPPSRVHTGTHGYTRRPAAIHPPCLFCSGRRRGNELSASSKPNSGAS